MGSAGSEYSQRNGDLRIGPRIPHGSMSRHQQFFRCTPELFERPHRAVSEIGVEALAAGLGAGQELGAVGLPGGQVFGIALDGALQAGFKILP